MFVEHVWPLEGFVPLDKILCGLSFWSLYHHGCFKQFSGYGPAKVSNHSSAQQL